MPARSPTRPVSRSRRPLPARTVRIAAIAEAFTAGFLVDIKAAIAVIRKAEARYPDDPTLPAIRAQLALLLDDRAQIEGGGQPRRWSSTRTIRRRSKRGPTTAPA